MQRQAERKSEVERCGARGSYTADCGGTISSLLSSGKTGELRPMIVDVDAEPSGVAIGRPLHVAAQLLGVDPRVSICLARIGSHLATVEAAVAMHELMLDHTAVDDGVITGAEQGFERT